MGLLSSKNIKKEGFMSSVGLSDVNFNDLVPPSLPIAKEKSCYSRIKKVASKAINNVSHAFQHAISFLSHSLKDLGGVRAFLKLGKSTIDFAKYAFSAESKGTGNLKNQFAIADGVLGIADFIADLKIWFVPSPDRNDLDENGKPKKKMFWNHVGVSRVDIAAKIFGTLSKVIGFAKFISDIGLMKLGKVAASLNKIPFFNVILRFSPVSVVKDSFDLISDSLGLISQGMNITAEKVKGKVFRLKSNMLNYIRLEDTAKETFLRKKYNDNESGLDTLKAKYLDSRKNLYTNLRDKLKGLGAQYKKTLEADSANKFDEIYTKYIGSDTEINTQRLDKKVEKVKASAVKQRKNWLNVAFTITKMVAAVLGLVGIFASLGALPVFLGVVTTLWLAVSVIGFVKLYYSYKNRVKLAM